MKIIGIGIFNSLVNDKFNFGRFQFYSNPGSKNEYDVKDGDAVVVPAGSEHNVINTSETESLKLYTIYSPAHHKDGIVRATKADAMKNEEEFDGVTSETK